MNYRSNSPSGARAHKLVPSTGKPFRRSDAVHGKVEKGSKGSLGRSSPVPGEVLEIERIDVRRPQSPQRQKAPPVAKPVLRLRTPRTVWETAQGIMEENNLKGVKPPEEIKYKPIAGAIPRMGSPLAHSLSGTKHLQGREGEPLIADRGETRSHSPASSLRTASISTTTSSSTPPRPSKFKEEKSFTLSSPPIPEKAVVTRSSSPIPEKTADKDRPRWRNFFKWPKREEATQSPGRQTKRKDRPASQGKESRRVKIVNASGFPAIKVDGRTGYQRRRDALEEEQIRSGNGWKVV